MALLPKLNSDIKFEVTVPSTRKTYTARPFLVKQEKAMMYAQEVSEQTGDAGKIVEATLDVIKDCIPEIDVKSLTIFDTEYIYAQLRSGSVGDEVNIESNCTNCDAKNPIKINLKDIQCDVPENVNNIVILEEERNISLVLSWFKGYELLKDGVFKDGEVTMHPSKLFDYIPLVIDYVVYNEEKINFKDVSKKERDEFINSLTRTQLTEIMEFLRNTPECKIDVKFTCIECDFENNIEIKGLSNFFS